MNNSPCTRVGDIVSDQLRELWPELASDLFPHMRRLIPDDQRVALRAEYNTANAQLLGVQATTDTVRASAAAQYAEALKPATRRKAKAR